MSKAGSALIDQGMVITGFEKPFKGSAPDIGAYERLGTRWTAGVNAIIDTGEGAPWSALNTKFTITTTTETCPNKDNGTIKIVADVEQDYVVSFNGTNTNFLQQITLENVAPGIYKLCIAINGKPESQCFNVEIKAAAQITGKSSLEKEKISVVIGEGSAPYTVFINNNIAYETSSQSFSIDVNQGDEVKIKSSKDCEGEIIEVIDFYGNVKSYPNPTNGDFQFLLPINEGQVFIEIYDVYSRLVSSRLYTIKSGKIDLSIKNQPSGIYFARIMNEKPINIKVIKK